MIHREHTQSLSHIHAAGMRNGVFVICFVSAYRRVSGESDR